MRRVLALAGLMLVACSQANSAPVAQVSPAPSASAASATSPLPQATSGTLATPATVADLPLSYPAFICKLPMATPDTAQAAFIAIGTMQTVSFVQGITGVHYFDRAYSRWLPVARQAVSPDGAHYAYVEMGDSGVFFIHIVDVVGGADHSYRETASASGMTASGISVFDYTSAGVYLIEGFEHVWSDVWLFDPRTNSIRDAISVATPELSDRGGIWYGDVDPADPKPLLTGTSAGTLSDELFRYDVKTGARTRWLYRAGYGVEILGADAAGRPLIELIAPKSNVQPKTDPIDHNATELLLGLDPNDQRSIFKGVLVESLGGPIADAHGVWFGGTQGIYLYSDVNGLQKISNQPGLPANGCF